MSKQKCVKKLLEKIDISGPSESNVIDTLLMIRPRSKIPSEISEIVKNGGVETLLTFLQKPNRKILDISMSILANCLTEEITREKMNECQGIPHIVKVLQTIKCQSILSRVCRSIGNLASHEQCAKTLHAIGTVELIIKLLNNKSTQKECLSSALRALKNLAGTPAYRKKLVQHGVVSTICKLLKSDFEIIVTSALRALSSISRSSIVEFGDHMLSNDGSAIGALVKIVTAEPDCMAVHRAHALVVLQNLTLQGFVRPMIGEKGAIKLFVNELKEMLSFSSETLLNEVVQGPLPEQTFSLISSVCYCCREAINRARLRSVDALPVLLQVLRDQRLKQIHLFTLRSLGCFIYDEEGLKILHDGGLFAILLDKLHDYIVEESETSEETECQDIIWDGLDTDDKESFDYRQALSSDFPTKFNQRPLPQISDSDDSQLKTMVDEFIWNSEEKLPSYSPQWSPVMDYPNINQLCDFTDDITPPDTPEPLLELDLTDDADAPLDIDDSSSSRDGFDQMQSPALLPASRTIIASDEEKVHLQNIKRELSLSEEVEILVS